MKKTAFFVCFFVLAMSAFCQQFLWSTVRDTAERYVPMNNVTREVLEFYDQYRFYYDYSGYSKDRFIEGFDYGFEDWEWLYEIEQLTVFALRSNLGRGSVVLVMCISKNNVNTIIFSNTSDLGSNWIMTHGGSSRDQFSRWFRTILN
jgi:hypothetical protein